MAKILVVGGAGYLGGVAVDQLIEKGHSVTVFDNLTFEERYLKPVDFIYGDITDTDEVVAAANHFDIVVWMAALVGDPACEVDREQTELINHYAVREFCRRLDSSVKIIFFSTCSVYGINEDFLNEDSAVAPLSLYASSKYAAESYVAERNGVILRLGTVYGLGDEHSRLRLDLVVNVMTMKAFQDGEITVNGGEQWRPIISTRDVAGFVCAAVDKFVPGTYNLCYQNVTIRDLGQKVADLTKAKIIFNDLPFQDLRNYQVDGAKAVETFGYTPCVSVEEEVSRIYKVVSERRIKDLSSPTYHNGQYLRSKQKVARALVAEAAQKSGWTNGETPLKAGT